MIKKDMKIQIKNISFKYPNGWDVFKNISFDIEQGNIIAILGPNGAGKSTLLNCVANLSPSTSGVNANKF